MEKKFLFIFVLNFIYSSDNSNVPYHKLNDNNSICCCLKFFSKLFKREERVVTLIPFTSNPADDKVDTIILLSSYNGNGIYFNNSENEKEKES